MKKIVVGIDISKEKIDASAIDVRDRQLGVMKLDGQTFENRPVGVRKGKDDKADSLMIAEYAMRHMDKAVMYESPNETVRELKALFLYRHKLVQERTEKKVRASHLKETAAKSKSMRFIVRDAMKGVRSIDKSIRDCEGQIRELILGDGELRRNYDHIVSVRGINIVNATAIIAYSNNFRGITTANKMASYYGVAPFREQSGTSVDKKAYVKYYTSSLLRATITQAAECTVQEHGIYRDYYLRMKERGKPYGIIINNVKNKLIHLVFSLVKNDMDYEHNHEFLRVKRKGEQIISAQL